MADPFYTPNIPSVSTHKRSYDAMDPDLDGRPVGTSRRNPSLESSSSPGGSHERNKRPRNNSESEVDDILVSSNTSMSSSGSSTSSIESYHSARSSFEDISPLLLPAGGPPAGQLPLLNISAALEERTEEVGVPEEDVSMDEALSFVARQEPMAPPPVPTPPAAPDLNEEMRRAMERASAFEREMSALRQSPAHRPPRWSPFDPALEELSLLEASFHHPGSFAADPFFPRAFLPLVGVPEHRDEPPSRPRADRDSLDDQLRRLETLERGAPLPSNAIRRLRTHQAHADNLFESISVLSGGEWDPLPSHPPLYNRPPSRPRIQPSAGIPNPQTRPSQDRRPPPIPSSSSRSPDLAAFFADDYMRRDRDREIETELENALRDAEAHRQRVAQFLSEYPSHSSFSTLRGALDDSSAGDHTRPPSTRRSGRPPVRPRPSNPPQMSRLPPWEPASEPAPPALTVDTTAWTSWEPTTLFDMTHLSDLDGSSSRQPSSSQQTDHDFLRFSPPLPPRMPPSITEYPSARSHTGSYLETNTRARSQGLSSLRHRYRPARSRSPPSPGPAPSLLFDSPASGSVSWTNRFPTAHSPPVYTNNFAPRTSTDDAMLQSFNDPVQPSAIPPSPMIYPTPLPDIPPPPPAPATQSRQYGNFDLDAYRAGPFRATLARSMALQSQNRTIHERSAVAEERRPRDLLEPISDSEDSEGDHVPPSFAPPPTRFTESFNLQTQRSSIAARQRVAPSNPQIAMRTSQTPASHASRTLEEEEVFAMSSAERRLASLRRASRLPDQTDRLRELLSRPTVPPAARHSAMSERERFANNGREPPVGQSSARSSGLDRWEQRRDVLRRMASRRAGGPDLPPSSATPSLASRMSTPRVMHEGPSPSMSSVRPRLAPRLSVYRPPSPPTGMPPSTAGRGEPRAPLNGRFARPRGFPPHRPPDMVWVDFPTGRFPPSGRRRNFGDYVRDEDLDTSYEGLLSLSSLLGDVKPRGTPADVVSALPRGTYGEWVRPGHTEERCPICLDDYETKDPCLRIPSCSHWFHEGCLQQWLKGARTCPVCRGRVAKPAGSENPAPVAGPSGSNSRSNEREDDNDSDDDIDIHWVPSFPPWRRD